MTAPETEPPATGRTTAPDARLVLTLGATILSGSALFMQLSGTAAGTAAFYRCLLALPVLLPLALLERRRLGGRGFRWQALDLLAGFFLGLDLVLWGESIVNIGTGIATVLNNVQVLAAPLLALLITRERLSVGFLLATPVMLAGVALVGGVADSRAFGDAPAYGALLGAASGVAYGGYLFMLRLSGTRHGRHRFSPVCLASVSAAATALLLGGPWQGVELAVGWPALGWLAALALSSQVTGLLVVGSALPRVPSSVGSTLLLLQPVLAVLWGVLLLGESPTWWQLLGCALVVGTVWFVGRRARS
ncbi:Threonine/homoserine efflux transporter RhtA [Actinopolyspora mzabensis]|uniref:Threonine/homoserine efflux transporter RhtA n=1 Tax=Actinopolyspora mzabensis TaxID=995066 RepID=A0A1G9D1S8_ACTMZ|nr:DMT family transporter [Actinopolyspora mzabensis]SDK57908.1 Threonine/homoserine efflux transporter RhtA [Actinopolyspora mzabensis]